MTENIEKEHVGICFWTKPFGVYCEKREVIMFVGS